MYLYVVYVLLSLAVALFGVNRKFGFWVYFFASLFLTPFVGLILVIASGPKPKA